MFLGEDNFGEFNDLDPNVNLIFDI